MWYYICEWAFFTILKIAIKKEARRASFFIPPISSISPSLTAISPESTDEVVRSVDVHIEGVADGNTVTYEIKDVTQRAEYSAMCESYNYGVIIGIVVFLVVAFGIFIFVIKRRG